MTSDTASDGSIVTETGISKIDDIFITGQVLNAAKEIILKSKISIYPNPARDVLYIQTFAKIFIEMFDIHGKQILNRNIINDEKIDISALHAGTYFFRIKDLDTQAMISETIIIQ